jgi:hypothetical protein
MEASADAFRNSSTPINMKWYFAARTKHTEALITISKFLETKGETIVSDWVYIGSLKPFEEHLEEVHRVNKHNIGMMLQADVFVMISDPEGTDMYAELGVGLAKDVLTKDIRIYIVGEHAKRSLMQLHPAIIHTKDLIEVFEREKISYDGFISPTF